MAVAEDLDIQSAIIPRIATGFCSGVAHTGGQCGALSGGILSLGLINGRRQPDAPVEDVYAQVQSLVSQFQARFGSINCQDLTGCHLGTPDGQRHFRETGQIEQCLDYAEAVTGMLLGIHNR